MSNHQRPDRGPEYPRSEPEIIPPGAEHRARSETSGVFIRIDEDDGVRRVYLKQPGPFAILLGLVIAGLIVATIVLLLAGLVLIWIPVAIIVIGAFLLSFYARTYWQRLRNWLAPR